MLTLFIISVMSFLVASNSSVTGTGATIEGMTASYSNSYKKGQIPAGHTATLTLEGLKDARIEKVTVRMHSNQSSGGGTLTMAVGGVCCWAISEAKFCDPEWASRYSSDWVDIEHEFTPSLAVRNERLTITISATENSLYVDRYIIEYQASEPRPYTVRFSSATPSSIAPQTEESVGAGVELPELDFAQGDWRFVGWTERPLSETADAPVFYEAGDRYFPSYDATLYALYSTAGEDVPYPESPRDGGVYHIADRGMDLLLSGGVVDDYWLMSDNKPKNGMNSLYQIEAEKDSLIRIRCMGSSEYIGYRAGALSPEASWWTLRERGEGAYDLLALESGARHMLFYSVGPIQADGTQPIVLRLYPIDIYTWEGLVFYNAECLLREVHYSSYPPGYEQGVVATTYSRVRIIKKVSEGSILIVRGSETYDLMGHRR